MNLYKSFSSGAIDVVASGGALVVLAVPLAASGGMAAFRQQGQRELSFCRKAGQRGGKIFRVVKFKTMTDERDARGQLLPDEARLTRVRAVFVRSTSIDELPQLWNVLKGRHEPHRSRARCL